MAKAELIEYAKNQLKAGSSANYIRTVLIKQGWGERDVDDALGIAQAEAGSAPSQQAATPAKASEAKPEIPSRKSKSLAIAGLLTGIFFVIAGGIIIYTLLTIGDTFMAMEAAIGATGLITGLVSNQMLFAWIFAIIGLVAGISWLITGIKELMK